MRRFLSIKLLSSSLGQQNEQQRLNILGKGIIAACFLPELGESVQHTDPYAGEQLSQALEG